MEHHKNLIEVHEQLVGGYVSKRYRHLVFSYGWDASLAKKLMAINPARAAKRVASYLNPQEWDRVKPRVLAGSDFSIRCGVAKGGSGNFGERGDFCLIGADHSGTTLTLHYRSLELFGGLVYDQAIIATIIETLNIRVKKVVVMASSCHSFALKGNSNEKLYQKIQSIYDQH